LPAASWQGEEVGVVEIKDKVALVTGAAMRVGRVIALALAGKGAQVAFTYLGDEEPWRKTLD
jgi:NAD(P)-dependent dehydrogenase (short-subunit alcohol dehydrogenase family)